MTILNIEVYNAAQTAIHAHGYGAGRKALLLAHTHSRAGETEKAYRFMCVWLAINEMQRNRPRDGEYLN